MLWPWTKNMMPVAFAVVVAVNTPPWIWAALALLAALAGLAWLVRLAWIEKRRVPWRER